MIWPFKPEECFSLYESLPFFVILDLSCLDKHIISSTATKVFSLCLAKLKEVDVKIYLWVINVIEPQWLIGINLFTPIKVKLSSDIWLNVTAEFPHQKELIGSSTTSRKHLIGYSIIDIWKFNIFATINFLNNYLCSWLSPDMNLQIIRSFVSYNMHIVDY